MGVIVRAAACGLMTLGTCLPAFGAPVLPPEFVIQPYQSNLTAPVDLEWTPGGDTLLVAEKRGVVRVVENDALLATPFVDIRGQVNRASDRGLLGIAVHPNFPAPPWVYLLYTYDPPETVGYSDAREPDGAGQRVSRLSRVTADATNGYRTAVTGSEVVVLGAASTWANIGDPAADQTDLSAPWTCGPSGAYVNDCIPSEGLSHSIGTVAFGNDSMLYVGSGDASTWTTVDPRALRALSIDSLAGKILRIDPASGQGVSGNPYWDGNAASNRSRVWQLGLRNPFRFVIEPATGDVWIGDVGWEEWEELNQGAPGADFGWPCYEGGDGVALEQPGYAALGECQSYYASNATVASVYGYLHVEDVGGAIVAGDVYTATKWPVAYRNKLFIADYTSRKIDYVTIDGGAVSVTPFGTDILAVDIAQGPDGDLYTADLVSGRIERIVYTGGSSTVPTVTIGAPVDGAVFGQGSVVTFSATATDVEDDDAALTAALSWTSDLDGSIGVGGSFSVDLLSVGSHLITAGVTDSGGSSASATITVGITVNTPPTATIGAPTGSERWIAGDMVNYSGVASDAQDGELTGAGLVWDAVIVHNTHEHPDYYSGTGSSGEFSYPDHDDDSHIRLCLRATDSGDLSSTDCVDLLPLTVNYTFASSPTGLSLTYNSESGVTPFSVLAAAGGGRQIFAPSPQGNYSFTGWSIGGAAAQQITIDSVDQTLTASFTADGPSWSPEAAYVDDFASGPPSSGWSYQWNANGPIGDTRGYADLQWNGAEYDSDGVSGLPDATELRYGRLAAAGGHAGWGMADGATVDRYVIASLTVSGSGEYRIAQSSVAQTGCQFSDGLDVRVYAGAGLVRQVFVPAGGASVGFDGSLGTLTAGDQVHAAAGPSTLDGCDSFEWDFTVERRVGRGPKPDGTTWVLEQPYQDIYTGGAAPGCCIFDEATGLLHGRKLQADR